MGIYAYTVQDPARGLSRGTLIADTPAEARRQLRSRGWRVVQFREARQRTPWRLPTLRFSRNRRQEQVAEWARHLAILLRTGVPLAEGLDVLIAQNRGRMRVVLQDLREHIAEGAALADGLRRHEHWFDPVVISAVAVGQASGSLPQALGELAEFLRERQSLYARLTGALIYPMVLLVLGVGVVLFLMTWVMPQLLGVLAASGRPLPASTLLLKALSDLLIRHGWLLGLVALAAVSGTGALLRTERGQRCWHRAQLRVPLLGHLVARAVIAQFAQMTVLLLRAGVPFVEAMALVRQSVRNRVLGDELQALGAAIEAGSDIAPSLRGSRIFPPLVVHLVAVGQETGELTEMLEQLRAGYETEVRLALTRFTAAFEPLLIVVLAALIGFVIFATLMPILEATRVMGN